MISTAFRPALVVIGVVAPLYALAARDSQTMPAPDRTWVKSGVTLYGLTKAGQLFAAPLGTNVVTVLADHHFGVTTGVRLSPDHRYILYHDGDADGLDGVYYVYDLKLRHERELRDLGDPEFSPDSSKILWYSNPLVVTDMNTLQGIAIANPDRDPAAKRDILTEGWSEDGKSVFVETMHDNEFGFYKYDVASKQTTQISGRQTQHDGGEFLDNGKPIHLFNSCPMQSTCGEYKTPSPSGHFVASIDENKDHDLYLLEKDREPELLEKNEWTSCEGDSIRQIAWLGSDDYLVFKLHGIPFVYGIKEKKKSVLFDPIAVPYYFW